MRRKANPQRFRKRPQSNPVVHDPRSTTLRQLRDLVLSGQYQSALTQADQLVAAETESDWKCRYLLVGADCLFRQGIFDQAAQSYAQISQMAQAFPMIWLRPALAEVASLLRNVQVDQAQARATAMVQTTLAYEQDYQNQLTQADATIAAGGQAVIPPQPPNSSVVANRLAKLFLTEGEAVNAKALFAQALQLNPDSSTARMGLAKIALGQNDPTTAQQLAHDAITIGAYRARTLPAWNLLLAAGRQLNTDVLDTALMNGLAQALPQIRSKSQLIVIMGLRDQGDARWKDMAASWLQETDNASQTSIAAEMQKLNLSAARRFNVAIDVRQQAAQQLLQIPNISPGEWLCATKEMVRATLLQNQTLDSDSLIAQGTSRYGQSRRGQIVHALAITCKSAGHTDLAIPLLQNNVNTLSVGDDWGRSLRALAQIQGQQGDHASAATNYWTFSQQASLPQRLRLISLVQWARQMLAANQPDALAQAQPQIVVALAQLTDYELVLDLAHQLGKVPKLSDFALQVLIQGQQLAQVAFDGCESPSAAAIILFKFCRRANDFFQYAAITGTWTRLSTQKRQWLWSVKTEYWNWLELVFRAYRERGQLTVAEQFIAPLLNDAATPAQGYAVLGASYATMKRQNQDWTGMFTVYERMIQVVPSNALTSMAYYWLALRAWKQGDATQTTMFADRILFALGKDWSTNWQRDLAAAAFCLKGGLNSPQAPVGSGLSVSKLQSQLPVVQFDLSQLSL